MGKWIRVRGVIAFVAIALALTVFWLFLAGAIVRRVVERTGTAIAGAEVDVAGAGLSLAPLGITLSGIQVTDPNNPSRNSMELGRVAFALDALNLLRRKVIIQEMSAEGLRFGTVRAKPGFVVPREERKQPEKKPPADTLPSFQMPDVKKILETEQFGSLKVIDDATAGIRSKGDAWQKRVKDLPDNAAIDAYRSRLDSLKGSSGSGLRDMASSAREAKKLADDIKRDLERVRSARTALQADLSSSRDLAAKAEQAPLDDVRRIRDKYGISPAGVQNMSRLLFGAKVVSWFDTGLLWYNRVSPLLSGATKKGDVKVVKPVRGKGVDVKFPERRPLPDFLIRTVKASLQPGAGSFSGTIRNITRDQDILGVPLTFQFDGSGMKDMRALSVSGALDHIRPDRIDDTIRISADGCSAENMVMSDSKALPISLQNGSMDIDVKGRRGRDGMQTTLVATFRSVRIKTGGEEGGAVLASLRSALAKVTAFSVTADISGEPGNYDMKISSDLDRVFKDAVGRVVQEQSSRLEKELTAAVRAKTGGKLNDLKTSLAGLSSAGGSIDSVQSRLESLLREATQQGGGGKMKLPF